MKSIGIIIKNNFKIILRNRVLIFAVVAGMILVIAALSNAFHELLGQAEKATEFVVGYQMSSDSIYEPLEDTLISTLDENDIHCRKYTNEQPENLISNGECEVFVDFSKENYHIYGNTDNESQTRIIQYVMFIAEENLNSMMNGRPETVKTIITAALPYTKTADANNYYSIVEMICFVGLSSVFLSAIMQEERRNRISVRYRTGGIGNAGIYFGKFIPCVLTSIVVMIALSGSLVTLLFEVEWGNIPVAFGLLSLEAAAFTAFGMLFLLLFDNMAVAVGALFMPLWFANFIGGTYESYMYSSFSEQIKCLSPTYYLNRTLCEISVSGQSDYLVPCIMYLCAILIVSIPLGILLNGRKER